MDTVETIAHRARAFLNDQDDQIFHTDLLLEFINTAFDEIHMELALRGIKSVQEVSSNIPMLASTINPTISRIQVPDLFYPISLREGSTGTNTIDFTDMQELEWDATADASDKYRYWTWREGEIKLPNVTTDTNVLIRYNKLALELDVDDSILLIGAKSFLALRTAELCAGPIGGRADLVEYLNMKAEASKDLFLSASIKQMASFGKRRRPFRRAFAH